ncbi:hypothetical protein EAS64_30770 [Trebonia kvetii]|uniref:Glycine transporter domain-containing protein n=1 Tax=Trebonia kvetii TaxID=2480626 RepID=A0A6P2BSA5_9ACTN|nr:TRIC cation channel family protein [Trebonia kvetii]TVZ01830.1 hypothetical protein EAS64_30770 [Trebonia kvetii]
MTGAASGSVLLQPLHVPLWIDLAAVMVGALAGAAIAAREELDVFGALLLAVVMGLGGGIVRDLLLGLRPVAVTSPYYLPTVTVAALAGLLFTSLMRRLRAIFVLLEALSDGLFMLVGVGKALYYGLPDVSAIFVGVCAAVGGGILADLLAGRPAAVIHRGPWNATAALVGASVYVTANAMHVDVAVSQAVGFLVVVAMRLASLRWDLQTPFPPDVPQRLNALRRQKGGPASRSGDDSSGDDSSHDSSRDDSPDGDQPPA